MPFLANSFFEALMPVAAMFRRNNWWVDNYTIISHLLSIGTHSAAIPNFGDGAKVSKAVRNDLIYLSVFPTHQLFLRNKKAVWCGKLIK